MLVDDDEFFVEATLDALRDYGFCVHAFTSGASFLKAMDLACEAKALLLDWTPPGLRDLICSTT